MSTTTILADAKFPLTLAPIYSMMNCCMAYWRSVRTVWHSGRLGNERAVRYLVRSMVRPITAIIWANRLEQLFTGQQPEHWRLLMKPHRHYINRRYKFTERANNFCTHHHLLNKLFKKNGYQDIIAGKMLQLASCTGKDGVSYCLILQRTNTFDREGELVLSLSAGSSRTAVYSIVFTFGYCEGHHCLDIGCLQGASGTQAGNHIKAATKSLHGLRPKNLVMDGLYCLARCWGIHRLYGIDNQSRVSRSSQVHADYDAFWRELGGMREERDGFFLLPEALAHHRVDEMPSHKRSAYRKRVMIRDELITGINLQAIGIFVQQLSD